MSTNDLYKPTQTAQHRNERTRFCGFWAHLNSVQYGPAHKFNIDVFTGNVHFPAFQNTDKFSLQFRKFNEQDGIGVLLDATTPDLASGRPSWAAVAGPASAATCRSP